MGIDRSLAKLAAMEQAEDGSAKSIPNVARVKYLSSQHDWYFRAAEFDRHIQQVKTDAQIKEREAAAKRHARLGILLQEKGEEKLAKQKLKQELSNKDAIAAIRAGVAIERVAIGLNTEQVGINGQVDIVTEEAEGKEERVVGRILSLVERVKERQQQQPPPPPEDTNEEAAS